MLAKWLIVALAATLVAMALGACGGEEEPEDVGPGGLPVLDIGELAASPGDFDEVRVEGVAAPLGTKGFVLEDETASIVVLSHPSPALRVQRGERVVVAGIVHELEDWQVDEVRQYVRDAPHPDRGRVVPGALGDVRFEPGAAYVELETVHFEDST